VSDEADNLYHSAAQAEGHRNVLEVVEPANASVTAHATPSDIGAWGPGKGVGARPPKFNMGTAKYVQLLHAVTSYAIFGPTQLLSHGCTACPANDHTTFSHA
jgi:hypothetical protein